MKHGRVLSFILSIVLAFAAGMSCAPAVYAAGDNTYNPSEWGEDYVSYMAIGDSFSRGMGTSDNWEEEVYTEYYYGDKQTRCITGAFPYIVAKELGCKFSENNYLEEKDSTFWPVTHYGLTLSGVLDLLGIDDDFYDTTFYHSTWSKQSVRYKKFLQYFGNPLSSKGDADEAWEGNGSVYDMRSLVEGMDVISVQLGQGDIYNLPLATALHEYNVEDFDLGKLSTEEKLAFAKRIAELVYEHYNYFIKAFPLLLDYLTEANPDADIVVLSAVNPAFGANLSDEIRIPIGNIVSSVSGLINAHIKKFAEEYGCIYIDISNVDTPTNESDLSVLNGYFGSGGYEIATHPSKAGHEQIARMILSALEKHDNSGKTDITLDMGRFSSVSKVFVDDKQTEEYTFENHILTVKNDSTKAIRLLVLCNTEDGKKAVSIYQLVYHYNTGYSAYRMYTTSDLDAVINNPLTILNSISSKIKGEIGF